MVFSKWIYTENKTIVIHLHEHPMILHKILTLRHKHRLQSMKSQSSKMNVSNIFCLFGIILICLSTSLLSAQELQIDFPASLRVGFEKGDATKIASSFQESLSFELPQQTGIYSKFQAEELLADFFKKNPTDTFVVQRNGKTGSAENVFTIGELVSGQLHFRVYMVRSIINNQYLIHSLSITKI